MSSREIADLLGSRHDDVKRSIERLVMHLTAPPLSVAPLHAFLGGSRNAARGSCLSGPHVPAEVGVADQRQELPPTWCSGQAHHFPHTLALEVRRLVAPEGAP